MKQQQAMKTAAYFGILSFAAYAALGQNPSSWHEATKPIISSTSVLVIVPTVVRSASGKHATRLDASSFRLTDNGVEQKVSVEEAENQPLAVVVLMQTGGAAFSRLQRYGKLDSILGHVLGSSTRKVALVTFDSRPEEIWNFPTRVDALYHALTHPRGGDRGAAIVDAVTCAIDLLQQQPANFRRVILLLSQARDDGSRVPAESVLRKLAVSGTTIYSLTFSPSPESTLLSDTINASTSHGLVLEAMHENTAAEVAVLSGGKRLRFQDEHDLEHQLSILAKDIHHGYTLSFHPRSLEPGFHAIAVQVTKNGTHLQVTSRTNYWFDGKTAK